MAVVVVALACGAALQSATGFGFSLLAAPLVFAALDPQEAVGLLAALGLAVNVLTLGTERRRPAPLTRDVRAILLAAAPGAVLGVVLLRALDAVALQLLVSAGVVATLAARHVAQRRIARARTPADGSRTAPPAWSAPLAGLLAGGLGTSTTTSGPPLLLHLLSRRAPPAVVRDTLSVCFLGLGLLGPLALLATRTTGAVPDPRLVVLGAPGVVAGHLVGRRAFAHLAAAERYERAITALLLASVAAGLAGVLLRA